MSKSKKNTAKPPRVREGLNQRLSHNVGYAGGKTLRKRMARLAARKRAQEETRENLRRKPKSVPENAYRLPGSLK